MTQHRTCCCGGAPVSAVCAPDCTQLNCPSSVVSSLTGLVISPGSFNPCNFSSGYTGDVSIIWQQVSPCIWTVSSALPTPAFPSFCGLSQSSRVFCSIACPVNPLFPYCDNIAAHWIIRVSLGAVLNIFDLYYSRQRLSAETCPPAGTYTFRGAVGSAANLLSDGGAMVLL